MQARQVSYGRKVSDGNYGSIVFDVAIILEEGDTVDHAAEYLLPKVNELLDTVKAREKAWEEVERKQHQPWKVTPEMVADQPTLLEKARKAAQLRLEHEDTGLTDRAHEKALEWFGVDVAFTKQLDGSALGEADGLKLVYTYNNFTVLVQVPGEEKPRRLPYVDSLEDLSRQLAQLEVELAGKSGAPVPVGDEDLEEIPF